jgi:tripartite-type tricarboxylate transporter receptor subunit TctC
MLLGPRALRSHNLGWNAISAAGLMVFIGTVAGSAQEQYPLRPIEVVTQYPPGGIADTSFRAIEPFLSKRLGVPLVVINKSGAGGSIATEYAKRAKADGYTILNGANTPLTTARATNKKLTYSISDFIALGLYSVDPTILVSRRDAPWKNFDEFIAYARARSGELSYGDGGLGGGGFFTMEIIKQARGLDVQAVHYRGSGILKTEILGGHIPLASGGVGALGSLVEDGQAIGLATTAQRRLPGLPDVPTLSELGIPEAAISPSMALFVPRDTPEHVVTILSNALADVMRDPNALAALKSSGMVPEYQDGLTTARLYQAEYEQSKKIAEKLNLVIEGE